MKLISSMGALTLLVASSFAQSATTINSANGGAFTVNSASYTATGTAIAGSSNFTHSGIIGDFNFRYAFAYRQTGDTREFAVSNSSGTSFSNTSNSWTGIIPRAVMGTGANTLEFTVNHVISNANASSPLLTSTVTVRNLDTITRGVTLFHYADWDVPPDATAAGNGPGDTIVFNNVSTSGITARQSDTTSGFFAETFAEGATRYRHGALYASLFSNTVIDNLDNTVTGGTGDFGMGMQWDEVQIGAGQSTSFKVYTALNAEAVPEPATMTVLGLAALAALKRRKK